jgi:hypothetical protein
MQCRKWRQKIILISEKPVYIPNYPTSHLKYHKFNFYNREKLKYEYHIRNLQAIKYFHDAITQSAKSGHILRESSQILFVFTN